jgi:hypothetical protein
MFCDLERKFFEHSRISLTYYILCGIFFVIQNVDTLWFRATKNFKEKGLLEIVFALQPFGW